MNGKLATSSCFALATVLGAFLLFQIEPVVGQIVTPVYGGTASVWTTCLLFFQSVVLVGYTFTCVLTRLAPRAQTFIYSGLFVLSVSALSIPPPQSWTGGNELNPLGSLIVGLVVNVALPCILLSTVSGMMQVWFTVTKLGNPYPLYSLSNIGSMAALLTYPTWFEPNWTVTETLYWWSAGYRFLGLMVALIAVVVWHSAGGMSAPESHALAGSAPIGARRFLWWMALAALGSIVLLSYTSYITSDIAPMPLLWVAPLAVYLLTFIFVFGYAGIYRRRLFLGSWMWVAACEPLVTRNLFLAGLLLNLVIVFMLCMICHGEMAADKPPPDKLPFFYLALSLGGASGGIFVAVVAPAIFNFEAERFVVLGIMGLITISKLIPAGARSARASMWLKMVTGFLVVAFVIAWTRITPANVISRQRNFYGCAYITQEGFKRVMYHGSVIHGQEDLSDPQGGWKIDPYVRPVQVIMDYLRARQGGPLQCVVVGLGTGAYASQLAPGDQARFYELDPKIESMAKRYFGYLQNCSGKVTVEIGDGRRLLKDDPKRDYDLIIIDAFNGDAVPCHLLTIEAMRLYASHLKPGGSIEFHFSNRYVDLPPLVAKLGDSIGMSSCAVTYRGGIVHVLLNRDANLLENIRVFQLKTPSKYPDIVIKPIERRASLKVWTDDFIYLTGVLKLL